MTLRVIGKMAGTSVPHSLFICMVIPVLLMENSILGLASSCSVPASFRNGTVQETRDSLGNKMLHFICDPGYILVGSKVLTCKGNNDWMKSIPQCHAADCKTHYISGARVDGLYEVMSDDQQPTTVLCDMTIAGGGWTVFQQRLNNFTSFFRNWEDYKKGFGDNKGNLWLGLETLHHLTWNNSELYVEIGGKNGIKYAQYSRFSVGGELDQYRLTIGGYTGNAGDQLSYNNGERFSTRDPGRDYDTYSHFSCAKSYQGAWWYKSCTFVNLNGLYLDGDYPTQSAPRGMFWSGYSGSYYYYSLKHTKMMLR